VTDVALVFGWPIEFNGRDCARSTLVLETTPVRVRVLQPSIEQLEEDRSP
jgi:hypothetical protein